MDNKSTVEKPKKEEGVVSILRTVKCKKKLIAVDLCIVCKCGKHSVQYIDQQKNTIVK